MSARATSARRRLSPRAVALLIVVAALLLSAVYPVRDLFAARAHVASLRRADAELDRRIAGLQPQAGLLATDEEVERIAREELGMVRPGERSFVIVNGPPARGRRAPAR